MSCCKIHFCMMYMGFGRLLLKALMLCILYDIALYAQLKSYVWKL